MDNLSNKPSSRVVVVIFVFFVILAAVLAWLWRANHLARFFPNGIKARYGLIVDDPLK
jgi:cell division protein FtsX